MSSSIRISGPRSQCSSISTRRIRMSEFNLICHGMMLFQERASDFLILMPEIKEHSFKYGTPLPVNPTDPSKGCQAPAGGKPVDILANFEITFPPVPVDYTLTLTDIPPQTGNVLRNPAIVSPANLLMIDGSKVE